MNRHRLIWLLLLLALAGYSTTARAETAQANFATALDQLDGVVSQFDQQVVDAQGHVLETSSGRLYLDKPRFRWEVEPPFPQIIVADEEQVLVYDPDLEQVTQRGIDQDRADSPLALLTRDSAEVLAQFKVAAYAAGEDHDVDHYVLVPVIRDTDTNGNLFARLEMVFSGPNLQELIIVDYAGQSTKIVFREFSRGQVLQSELFKLELPTNVDIVRG